MYTNRAQQGAAARIEAAAAMRGAEVTLNEQLLHDTSGKFRDQVLDELAVAAEEIQMALQGPLDAGDAKVLYDLLAAVRVSESVVAEAWEAVHGFRVP
jgi:hypothetical protein